MPLGKAPKGCSIAYSCSPPLFSSQFCSLSPGDAIYYSRHKQLHMQHPQVPKPHISLLFFFMAIVLEINMGSSEFIFFVIHHFAVVVAAALVIIYLVHKRKASIYLLDFTCYRPPASCRVPISMHRELVSLDTRFDPDSIAFQIKILERSGFSSETCVPPSFCEHPIRKSLSFALEEASLVIFSVVTDLLKKTNINPKSIDILVLNSSMFSPTPSLSAMVINKFRMRSNIRSFNLSGMGCSAGIVSIGLARDLLRVHRNSLALIVSTEVINLNWYTGKNRSMLLTNCLFRMGGAAILMSSQTQDMNKAKYVLQHLVRTNRAGDDQSYACVFQDMDLENNVGVSISKGIINVAGDALKANMASTGPLVLPFSEQFLYGLSIICRKIWRRSIYVPNFRRAFEHFCIHAGGRAVIEAMEKSLRLKKEDVEASRMTLYRFGNTSSSSIWYELSYLEAKGRMKKGDRVWQIAFGSGFKCNSAIWKCIREVGVETNVWSDRIHSYPIHVLDILKD